VCQCARCGWRRRVWLWGRSLAKSKAWLYSSTFRPLTYWTNTGIALMAHHSANFKHAKTSKFALYVLCKPRKGKSTKRKWIIMTTLCYYQLRVIRCMVNILAKVCVFVFHYRNEVYIPIKWWFISRWNILKQNVKCV
jgi:hypothetical protein